MLWTLCDLEQAAHVEPVSVSPVVWTCATVSEGLRSSPGTYDVNSFKRSTAHLATRWGQNRENSLTEDFSTPFDFYLPLTVLRLTTTRALSTLQCDVHTSRQQRSCP